jgi:hypothetical protein
MEIKVHQLINSRFFEETGAEKMSELHHVATVQTDSLDQAYAVTNSVMQPWTDPKLCAQYGVTPMPSTRSNPFHEEVSEDSPFPYRSTSVGDMMEVINNGHSDWYVVAGIGFKQVKAPQ